MIVTDLLSNIKLYNNMSIWSIPNLEEFMKMHNSLQDAFKQEYQTDYTNRFNAGFMDPDQVAITKLLDYFEDKHFFVFSLNDQQHMELIMLQDKKILNFGIDINQIRPDLIYVLEMDKTTDLKAYDTV